MSGTATPPALPARFAAAMAALCRIVCAAGPFGARGRHPAIAPLAPFLVARFVRLSHRFRALAERVAAGMAVASRPRRARRREAAAPDDPSRRPARPPDPLPRGDAWLLRRLMRPELEQARLDLVSLTNDLLRDIDGPEMRSLCHAAPQAGRLLRPLIRLTRGDAEIPAWLRLPPRPKRPKRPKRPRGRRAAAGDRRVKLRGATTPHPIAPDAPAPTAPPPPAPKPPAETTLWRVVPVIRVVWRTRRNPTIRIRAGPRPSRH